MTETTDDYNRMYDNAESFPDLIITLKDLHEIKVQKVVLGMRNERFARELVTLNPTTVTRLYSLHMSERYTDVV